MLKKRLIGVICVKNGMAVQSFSYKRHLPLGRPELLAENLERWGIDEIFLQCIDRTPNGLGPDFEVLERVGKMGLATPLVYGGGIRSADDGVEVVRRGADRICIDSVLHDSPDVAVDLSQRLGAQALIVGLPLETSVNGVSWIDYRDATAARSTEQVMRLLDARIASEAMVIDWRNEGTRNGFNFSILTRFPHGVTPLIAFGGLSEPAQLRQALENPRVSAVAIGNFLNYREHAVRELKTALAGLPIRMPS